MYRKISRIFKTALENKPAIVFIDNVDCLYPIKWEIVLAFIINFNSFSEENSFQTLVELDYAISNNVFVFATSNAPWDIHNRVLRRFHRRIYIDLPSYSSRKAFLLRKLSQVSHILQGDEIEFVTAKTEGYFLLKRNK